MVKFLDQKQAFGPPGIAPRWTHANKDGVGTAYSISSRVWFTVWNGVVTEVYHPTVDRPQIRDLQYLITDAQSFFHEEKRHLDSKVERMWPHGLGYRITNSEKVSGDGGNLYHSSFSLLLAHEDKTCPGALIASLAIPWGEAKGDQDQGGYHLVWTRDLVSSAAGLV